MQMVYFTKTPFKLLILLKLFDINLYNKAFGSILFYSSTIVFLLTLAMLIPNINLTWVRQACVLEMFPFQGDFGKSN